MLVCIVQKGTVYPSLLHSCHAFLTIHYKSDCQSGGIPSIVSFCFSVILKMPKIQNKNHCSKCNTKHVLPTGKKCKNFVDNNKDSDSMELQHTQVSSVDSGSESMDSDINLKQFVKNRKVKSKVTKQLDC